MSKIENVSRREDNIIKIWTHLEDNGPMPQRKLSEKISISTHTISKHTRESPDIFERFKFCGGGSKYNAYDLYGDLLYNHSGPIVSLRDDPRLIDFIAKKTSFEVKDSTDAAILVTHFKEHIGNKRARELAQKKGHVYHVYPDVYTGSGFTCEVCHSRQGKVISKVDGKILCMTCWKATL